MVICAPSSGAAGNLGSAAPHSLLKRVPPR